MIHIEELIAEELEERLAARFDGGYGVVEFYYDDIELDADVLVAVEGAVEYETEYEEAVNYSYLRYVSVDIARIEGVKADRHKVAKYLKDILYG